MKETERLKEEMDKTNKKKVAIEKFTLTNFTLVDIIDLLFNQFDQFILNECPHFKDQIFMDAMISI